MKNIFNKNKIQALLIASLLFILPSLAYSQCSTVTVTWSTGWCSICNGNTGNYSCDPPWSGSGMWNNGIRTFADPVPPGNIVTSVSIVVEKVNCGYTNLCVTLNGAPVQCLAPVGGNCGCGTCWPQTFTNTWPCPTGAPNYVYGGINQIQLINTGTICVSSAIITICYQPCCPPPPAIPNMNGPTTVCEGGTYTYSVPTMPLAQSYNWTVPTGATVQSGQGTNTVTVQFGNTSGNICVNYTDTCTNSPDLCVPIQVDLKPSPSNAGPDQFICGAVGQLAGNIPGIGTGLWNVLFGGSTVSNPTQNNSMVNNLSVGPNTFEWEITNTPACPSSRDTVVLTRYAQPQADFVATTVCFGTPTVFVNTTNNNGANIASYEWDLNSDGIMDYFVPNFSHTFALPGIYNSCLIVTTTDGCKDTICKPVVVNPMPIADYTANNVCDGATMSFFNTSNILSGTIDVYDWQFGDGSSSNLVNPTHLYAGPGLYTVTLTVTSDSGCTSSITKTIQIYSNPTANFSAPNQCLYDAVNFFDQSVVGNATITGWNWNFGDNTTSNIQHPSHLYSFYNNYQVQLIVTSSQGCNDTIIKTVVVHPVPTANFTANNVCLGDPTNFVNLSTIPQGSFSEQWFFGDGSNTNTFNATHNYLQPGNFIPYLVITSDSGCKDTAFLNIEVWAIPEPQFSLNNTCENDTVIFTDLSQIVLGNIVGWTWDFGNGLPVSNQQNPYNFYYAPGGYTVILTTTSDKGCVKTLTKQIDIFPSPKVEFAYSDELVGCSPLCIDFFDQSTINPMYNSTLQHYLWNFGDEISSVEKNPTHCYSNRTPDKKIFSVDLTVKSNLGCKGYFIIKDLVDVYPQPTAEFTFDPFATTILNPEFRFTDHSWGHDSLSWNFGDGSTSSVQNPKHTYEDTGTFNVSLVVKNSYGCTDTVSYKIIVRPEFQFYIPNAFTPGGDGINDVFRGTGFGFDFSKPENYNMKIYDRWGELIFETNDYASGWNGMANGKKLKPDAFVYFITVIDTYGMEHEFRGTVTLVR
ncbi:immune inhibitor A [Flavobacteriales bacterium]|nr:hypothetical protein [Flavobacteriales bacterium]MCL4816585.1 PKD domain-containing protein [Flavobacteriales bacterium]CAG0998062.1 immune inhibitor A [Flavobacteriales bacterium]